MSTESPHSKSRLLAEEAIGEALVDYTRREEARAKSVDAPIGSVRARATRVGLLIAVPLLVAVALTNLWRPSLFTTLSASQSTAARQEAEEALRAVVDDIQSFHADYAELPMSLTEIGMPDQGAWTYTRKPDGGYHLAVMLRGRVATFEGR